ncbi:MAG: hypothetical protein NTU44_02825 [Bacteroidetes bacterium]|nr:hypothetical protein [Bacteroidota bacterium]
MKTMNRFNNYNQQIKRSLPMLLGGLIILISIHVRAQITITKQDAHCGKNDGSAAASVNHGVPPYTFTWSNGSTGASISNLAPGTYTVTVKDSKGCKGQKSTTIKGSGKISVSVNGGGSVPFCVQDGPPTINLSASASGGEPPYTWSPGPSMMVSGSGKYTFTAKDVNSCSGKNSVMVTYVPIRCSRDPNEILGPDGYGEQKFISSSKSLNYIINFENDPDFATAPAQKVVVTYQIDPHMGLSGIKLGDFGFGNLVFTVPPNTSNYSVRLDARDSLGVFVDVTAGINLGNNTVFWIFQAIDPATGLPPEDPLTGMLPINDTLTHRGEGNVSFNIKPKSTTQTGDSLKAAAVIVFDLNPPLPTNTWTNTADAIAPVSHINALSSSYDTTSILITITGNDDTGGSGVEKADLYVSENNGPFLKYGEGRVNEAIRFDGKPCTSYGFFSIASDNTGNTEPMKNHAEGVTTLKPPPTVTVQPLSVQAGQGTDAHFSLTASGASYYQWEMSNDGGDNYLPLTENPPYAGINSADLSVMPATSDLNGFMFRCLVSNGYCFVNSTVATLNIISSLSGLVRYSNENQSVMANTKLVLKDLNGNRVDSTLTNTSGNYLFSNVIPGEYIVYPEISKPWGGANATDALRVLLHFSGLNILEGIYLKAGDVNLISHLNAVDALLIARRFVHAIESFPAGDWVEMADTVNLGYAPQIAGFFTLCYGDVDGSFVPAGKYSPGVTIAHGLDMTISSGREFTLPFLVNKDVVVGSVSLVLTYPSDYLELLDVKMKTPAATEEMIYTKANGQLRIGWYSLSPFSVDQGEPLLSLSLRAADRPLTGNLEITAEANSEVAERYGKILPDFVLYTPKLVSEEQPETYFLGQNYPNPFNQNTEISFYLPDDAWVNLNLFNSTGQLIKSLLTGWQAAGYHKVMVNAGSMASGTYPYRLEIKNSQKELNLFHILTISN